MKMTQEQHTAKQMESENIHKAFICRFYAGAICQSLTPKMFEKDEEGYDKLHLLDDVLDLPTNNTNFQQMQQWNGDIVRIIATIKYETNEDIKEEILCRNFGELLLEQSKYWDIQNFLPCED